MDNKGENKREFYRLRYPTSCRPTLILLGKSYEVIDICEKGVKFLLGKYREFKPGLDIQFTIDFHDDSLDLAGKILRVDENTAVIYLEETIPLGRIIKEQRYVRDMYPDYFQS
jgi:hypothetical protein